MNGSAPLVDSVDNKFLMILCATESAIGVHLRCEMLFVWVCLSYKEAVHYFRMANHLYRNSLKCVFPWSKIEYPDSINCARDLVTESNAVVRVLSLLSNLIFGLVTEPWHSCIVMSLCERAVSSVVLFYSEHSVQISALMSSSVSVWCRGSNTRTPCLASLVSVQYSLLG